MQCAKPLFIGKDVQEPVGCGQCMPCRINRRREWTARILLEDVGHMGYSAFVTLTYNDESVPWQTNPHNPKEEHQILKKTDLQKFFKRLRHQLNQPIRYFACGEYGSQTSRPHYHLILFGVDPEIARVSCEKSWGKGFVTASELNPQRAAYTASYVAKKWMKKDTPELLGRPPEFSVSSKRPAIGIAGLGPIVESLQTRRGAYTVAHNMVTRTVRLNGKVYPLDRTMTRHLLEGLGLPSKYEFSKTAKNVTLDPNTAEGVKHGKEAVKAAQYHDKKLRFKYSKATARNSV